MQYNSDRKMSLVHTIKHDRFFKDPTHSDVEFIAKKRDGSKVKFPAHRQLLMSQSTVFEQMLQGDMKEGLLVSNMDVCAEAFEEFLQFFYLVEVKLTSDHIADVLKLVKKYDTSHLWPVCEAFMEQTLTVDTAFHYYELALSHKLSANILDKLEEIICKNSEKAFKSSADGGANMLVLSNILKLDTFLYNEIEVSCHWRKRHWSNGIYY